jgi:hypothetical protein
MSTRPAIGQAFGILATAFLASMAVSSFFFIKPGDAMANAEICQTQGVLTDGAKEAEVVLTVSLSPSCIDAADGILRGIDSRGISHLIGETSINRVDSGYITETTIKLDAGFEYYTFEVGNYFYAEIAAK